MYLFKRMASAIKPMISWIYSLITLLDVFTDFLTRSCGHIEPVVMNRPHTTWLYFSGRSHVKGS